MTEIRFYHLTRSTLEQVLPELLDKTLQRDLRAVVIASSPERVEALAQHLWIYKPDSFLPHGSNKDGSSGDQPIWITSTDERPNDASFLFLTDGAVSERLDDYARVCEIFDGNDDAVTAAARERWARYKAAGHALSYWQQGDNGWSNSAAQT